MCPVKSDGTETGWIHKFAFVANALATDATGRQAMQDGYIENAKIADTTITAAKMASGALITGIYGTAIYGTSIYG